MRQANPHKGAQFQASRRTRLKRAQPKWLNIEQIKQIEIFYKIANKMTKTFNIKYSVDHVIPLQGKLVSGLHVPWNLQILTKSKNSSKGNRL